jgi:hypothetical protein
LSVCPMAAPGVSERGQDVSAARYDARAPGTAASRLRV